MRFKQANRVIMSVCFVMASLSFAAAQTSDPRAGGFTQADRELLTRQQIRMDTFEESLKELRGQVELEVKNTRTQIEKLSSSLLASTSGTTVNAQEIRSELARLNDSIAILNQRLARTIEMSRCGISCFKAREKTIYFATAFRPVCFGKNRPR